MIPPIFALLSWPVILSFASRERSLAGIVIFSIIGGYLFLPDRGEIDLPVLPAIDKHSMPAFAALIFCLALASTRQEAGIRPGWIPQGWLPRLCLVGVVAGVAMTALTNGDVLVFGPTVLPAIRLYDMASLVLDSLIFLIPFLLARKFLGTPEALRLLMFALCGWALIYSFLALYEVRMSPQISQMVYDYFPHSWLQHVRGDGYRPVVFLRHGLRLSLFLCIACIVTFGLIRLCDAQTRTRYIFVSLWLLGTLFLSKSMGATILAILFVPVVLLMSSRMQLTIAALFTTIVIAYPILRSIGVIPIEGALNAVAQISAERSHSLGIRFDFEERLMNRAVERPIFGWGGWGRSLLFDERGRNYSVPDGFWVMILGTRGWVGYVSYFLLLGFPVIALWWQRQRYQIGMVEAVLAMALTVNLIDLVPNSGLTPVTYLLAGALWGRLELGRITDAQADPAPVLPRRRFAPPPVTETSDPDPGLVAADDAPVQTSLYTRQTKRISRMDQRSTTPRRSRVQHMQPNYREVDK